MGIERFEDIVRRADGVTLGNMHLIFTERRQKYDRDVFCAITLLDQFGCFKAVKNRHLNVKQNNGEILRKQVFQGLAAGRSFYDLIIRRPERFFERQQVLGLVIDDEDGCFIFQIHLPSEKRRRGGTMIPNHHNISFGQIHSVLRRSAPVFGSRPIVFFLSIRHDLRRVRIPKTLSRTGWIARFGRKTSEDLPRKDGMPEIEPADIEAAAKRLNGHIRRTPIITSTALNERTGAEIFCKCENMQRVGAFKFRGAFNMMSQLAPDRRTQGVAAFSSGNHAQAVARVGKLLHIPAVIVMPHDSPAVKLDATRRYGAEVVLYDRTRESREAIAERLATERRLSLVPPFDHPDVIAGQGTAALELLADRSGLDVLVLPIGGGGLISGSGIIAHAINPRIRVIGVEPESANDTFLSLQKGRIVSTPLSRSIADGLLSTAPGKLTFPIMQKHLESVVLVTDEELAEALRFLLTRLKLLVEPSGCAPVAALMSGKIPNVRGKKVGVILSGGNVDPVTLARILAPVFPPD